MNNKKNTDSAYIHIPFCKSKCHYCNFVSFADKTSCIKTYFRALRQELLPHAGNFRTIYVGGGTPSLVRAELYEELLTGFTANEMTIEVNPGTVTAEYLQSLRKIGFNRLSIGVQSFDDDTLKTLNRPHTAKDARNTVRDARNAGFENISIDLIYGLPEQNPENWQEALTHASRLEINHISTYGLKIEKGTVFGAEPPENLPDEDEVSRMYVDTVKILQDNGFSHYEISNFAKPGKESQHNLVYWKNMEYFGFGLAAHGYTGRVRYSNKTDLDNYIKNPLEKAESKKLSEQEIIEEAIFLGLRLREGINLKEFENEYRIDLQQKYGKFIDKHVSNGFMEINENRLRLTLQGVLLSNNILADFLE